MITLIELKFPDENTYVLKNNTKNSWLSIIKDSYKNFASL